MSLLEDIIKRKPNELVNVSNKLIGRGFMLKTDEFSVNFFEPRYGSSGGINNIEVKTPIVYPEEVEELMESAPEFYSSLSDVMEYLKYNRPYEFHMLKKMNIVRTRKVDTACSYWDSVMKEFVIEYNDKFVKVLADISQVTYEKMLAFVLEHELLHILMKHVVTDNTLRKHHNLDNMVEDLIINRYLRQIYRFIPRIGINDQLQFQGELKSSVSLKSICQRSARKGLVKVCSCCDNRTSESIATLTYYNDKEFRDLDEKTLKEGIVDIVTSTFKDIDNMVCIGSTMDEVDLDMNKESISILSDIVDTSISEAVKDIQSGITALSRGAGAGYSLAAQKAQDIERPIGYKKSELNWKSELRKYMRRGLSSTEIYSQSSPNARIEGQFGRDIDIQIPKTLLFAIDVSGSMGIEDYEFALSEIDAIIKSMKLRQIEIIVVWWGTSVRTERFSSYREFKARCQKQTPSLGGTDVNMMLKEISVYKKADIIVVFTDGEFAKANSHRQDILWCVTKDGHTKSIPKSNKDKIVQPE